MSNSTKDMLIRLATHTVMLLFLFVFQSMVFSRMRILGIAPLILPLAVVGVAMFEGATWGGGFGIAAGVFCDVSHSEAMVLYTIVFMLLGVMVGLLSEYVLVRGIPSYLLCSILTLIIIAFFEMFAFLVFTKVEPQVLIKVALKQTIYSLLFALPVYYIARKVCRQGF